jgi:hypothetical protein
VSFYVNNEGTMRKGFKNILSNYKGTTVPEINNIHGLREYLLYLGSAEFRENIQKNFAFIGMMSVRQLATIEKDCDFPGSLKKCHQKTYSAANRQFRPFRFEDSLTNQTKYIYFQPPEQHRIFSVATGTYSSFDGSGYQLLFDHTKADLLALQNQLAISALPKIFAPNTKAVVVNFNLNYPAKNVNVTTEIVLIPSKAAVRGHSFREHPGEPAEDPPVRVGLREQPAEPLHHRHPAADLRVRVPLPVHPDSKRRSSNRL